MSDNQIFNEIGKDITEALSDSLKNGDFTRLNRAINNSVNRVLDEATEHLEKGGSGQRVNSSYTYSTYRSGDATRQKMLQLEKEREAMRQQRQREAEIRQQQIKQREEARAKYREKVAKSRQMRSPNAITYNGKLLKTKFRPVGDASSIVQIIFGAIGALMFGSMALIAMFAAIGGLSGAGVVLAVMGALAIGSGVLIGQGISKRNLISRAKRYASLCGEKMYAPINELARNSGISRSKLIKDIRKLLNLGMYPEGHLDEDENTLILSDEVYHEYLGLQKTVKQAEEAKLSQAERSEIDIMISDGMNAIKHLHELNDDIPGEVISKKLARLEGLLRQIFDRIKEHPEQIDRIHKLMDYYLPTMLKLVEAYRDYDKVETPGIEIINAKQEIENTLDTINEAFVQLLNNLFQDSVWDVTTDAQVLKTMLTQEGLTKEEELKTL